MLTNASNGSEAGMLTVEKSNNRFQALLTFRVISFLLLLNEFNANKLEILKKDRIPFAVACDAPCGSE